MALLSRFKRKKPQKNNYLMKKSGFFSDVTSRTLSGWDTVSNSIDFYLRSELTMLRARSRKLSRTSTYGSRYIDLLKSNIVGSDGIKVNSQKIMANGKPDKRANKAIEDAWADWCNNHADFNGKMSFVESQGLSIACAAQDGEFIFEKVQSGKYGFQLKAIDAELLDVTKNEPTRNGEIRLGVEYDGNGRVIRYWFREKNFNGNYNSGKTYSIRADRIIHCFVPKYPDQSRGIPWTHSAVEATRHLEKYQEGAIVNARASANTFFAVKHDAGDEYEGNDPYSDDISTQDIEQGGILNIGNKEIIQIDPNYPHQMYDAFIKANLRSIASGLGVSYHSLSNDLEGVSFSSIRSGVLEDRELFKFYQNWFIRSFVKPVFEEWLLMAYTKGQIRINGTPLNGAIEDYQKAAYQPRRWSWVDPQKDMTANQMYINERLKSRSQIMREQGDDPESIWAEIAKEEEIMLQLGIAPINQLAVANSENENEE